MMGWNTGVLDSPVKITAGEAWWIAVTGSNDDIELSVYEQAGCDGSLTQRYAQTGGTLPDPFAANQQNFDVCRAALYLTP